MSTVVSQHCAKVVRQCIVEDNTIAKSLAELGLVNAKISVIHEKGTDKSQVNLCFDLSDGDNIEGVARKFGMGLMPTLMQKIQSAGMAEKPITEFFCIPQTLPHQKDVVVAVFSFNENLKHATGITPQPLN